MYLKNDKKKLIVDRAYKNSSQMDFVSPSFRKLPLQEHDNSLESPLQLKSICPCDGTCPKCEAQVNANQIPHVQSALKVSGAGDPSEREAENISKQIMDPSPSISRIGGKEKLGRDQNPIVINRRNSLNVASTDFEYNAEGIKNATKNGGKPLDSTTKKFMESRFGYDFSKVRIHADSEQSSASARSVKALAYTFGNDIVFGEKKYSPNSFEGKKLLAHELAHVVQQNQAPCPLLQRQGEDSSGFGEEMNLGPEFGGVENYRNLNVSMIGRLFHQTTLADVSQSLTEIAQIDIKEKNNHFFVPRNFTGVLEVKIHANGSRAVAKGGYQQKWWNATLTWYIQRTDKGPVKFYLLPNFSGFSSDVSSSGHLPWVFDIGVDTGAESVAFTLQLNNVESAYKESQWGASLGLDFKVLNGSVSVGGTAGLTSPTTAVLKETFMIHLSTVEVLEKHNIKFGTKYPIPSIPKKSE